MRRERGFTLYELLVVMVLTGTIGLAASRAVGGIHAEERKSRAYVQDLTKLRRVARVVRDELRNGTPAEELENRFGEQVEIAEKDGYADVKVMVGGELRFTVRRRVVR